MATWKKVIVSGSNAELATLNATAVTASLLGNVVGDLTGTASWAVTASWALNSPAAISSSYALSASYALNASTADFATNATNAVSSSYILGSNVDGTVATATSASYASNASTADDSDLLQGQNGAYYTNATNINAGTIGNAYLPSAINVTSVTASLLGNVVGNLTGTATTASFIAASSAAQGQVTVGTGPAVDLGLETTDSVTFANLAVNGSGSFSGALVVQGDLTVNGTASFINTQELLVEDKFVTFASGSTTLTDGGFIVSQAAGNIGQAFAFQSGTGRWGVQSGVAYNATSITPEAYTSLVAVDSGSAAYSKTGNIFVDGAGDIFMYS